MISLFSADPERSRVERCAQLEYEIKGLTDAENELKDKLKKMEEKIQINLKVI